MKYSASSPEEYVSLIPQERRSSFNRIRHLIKDNLPSGFVEGMNYGMIGYFVPHSIYPAGYHCSPELPLPFMNLASKKNSINLYHMGLYADASLYEWFIAEYKLHSDYKLDMGKSCIRFKRMDAIPYELLESLCTKMSVDQWIVLYESNLKKSRKETKKNKKKIPR